MYRLLFFAVFSLFVIKAEAQTVTDMFIDMPDSIIPYIDSKQRKELVELKQMEPDSTATIGNNLGKIKLTRLSDSILTLKLSECNTIELGKLEDNKFVFIKTYGAPLQESLCCIIDNKWRKNKMVDFSDINFIQESDSIPELEQREMMRLLEFSLISASIATIPDELIIKLNTPLVTTEEKKKFDAITLQRNVKWNGKTFN
jgi:hypothetical protein